MSSKAKKNKPVTKVSPIVDQVNKNIIPDDDDLLPTEEPSKIVDGKTIFHHRQRKFDVIRIRKNKVINQFLNYDYIVSELKKMHPDVEFEVDNNETWFIIWVKA